MTMGRTLDKEQIQLISLFEQSTRARVKDAFEDKAGTMTFIVESGELFKALGKQASNIRRLENRLNKKVRVIEFAPDLEEFIRNVTYPNKCDIRVRDKLVKLIPHDLKTRGNLIGRAASHLRNTEMIVQRYFPIERMVVTQVQEQW